MKTVTFYFDFGSPTSYLASVRLPKIAAETGAKIEWQPMLLGGVLKATGNRSPAEIPAKAGYMLRDLSRFAVRDGIPLTFNPHFPINTLLLMRLAVAVKQLETPVIFEEFVAHVYRAIWVEERNLSDLSVLNATLIDGGFDGAKLMAAASAQTIKDALRIATETAVEHGVFGAPTMFVGDEMFFGQDRLDFVRDELERDRT